MTQNPMKTLTITTRTDAEVGALFETIFKNVKGTEPTAVVTQEQRLEPYRKHVLKLRKRGVSWEAIAAGMGDPRLGEKVSAKLLRRVFDGPKKTPAAKPPTPPVEHLILDPLTLQPITPPRR